MKRRILTLTTIVAMTALTTLTWAQGPGRNRGAQRAEVLAEYIQLDSGQKEAWTEIREETRAQAEPLAKEAQAIRKEVRAALEGGANPAAVGQLVIDGHELKNQIRTIKKSSHQKLESLLDDSQRDKLAAFQELQQIKKKNRGERGPRHGSRS